MELELNVMWNTDEVTEAIKTGMSWGIEDCTTKKVIFYNINCIGPAEWGDKYTKVHANGDYWVVPYTVETLRIMIRAARQKDLLNFNSNS